MKKMRKKSVCIIRSNPVNPDSRVEKEAEALIEAGYSPQILCWDRERSYKIKNEYIHKGRIPIARIGFKAGYAEGIRCIKSRIGFQLHMIEWILLYGKEIDVIHACDIDTALFSYIPSKIRGCKYVFDLFDFQCGDPKNIAQKLIRKLQIGLISKADLTIICTEERRLQICGSKPKKIAVVHNSPDTSFITESDYKIKNDNRISIAYVGVFLENRLLKEMIHYISNNDSISFYIGGFGKLEKYIRNCSKRYNNIHYLGKLSYGEALSLERQCDLMTAIYDPQIENHKFAAPNKFYESLMLGKPIIMVRGTGMAKEVENNDIGVLIDYSEESFADGLKNLIERKSEWNEMGEKMKKLYEEKYNWSIMKRRLTDAYNCLFE